MRPVKQVPRPLLGERIQLWASTSRRVDGLWVGTQDGGDEAEAQLRRVEEALCLIKTHDRLRYDRLLRDLDRVWVAILPGIVGCYSEGLRACQLDPRHVLDENTPTEVIASTIVHEATHARLHRAGIGYDEARRDRIEAVCVRRELAFARKLPDGEEVRAYAGRLLELCAEPGLWTDAKFDERFVEGSAEALQYLGVPAWLVRIILGIRVFRLRLRRLVAVLRRQ
jgi:hypothetical protein